MPDKVLTSLNWLDLLMILVIIISLYRGAVHGFVVEIFKIVGLYFSTVLSLHFYVWTAYFLREAMAMPLRLGEIVSFVIISIFILLLFRLVREGWLLILKVEAKAGFSQWGGMVLGLCTSFLTCGLLFFGILLLGNQTLEKFVRHSVSGYYLFDLSPNVYKATYTGLIAPFFPDEVLNEKVFETVARPVDRE